MPVLLIIFVVLGVLILRSIVVIVPQAKSFVIERLGSYHKTWNTGVHFKVPFIEKVAATISLKEVVIDFTPQPVITKDNVTMMIDTVVYYRITDPKLYTYGIQDPLKALENLTATTLRNLIGDLELDETLTSRDIINTKMRAILDEATDPWGVKVGRVEVKNIIPPKDIQEAMEKQMRAERERREKILQAEGEKRSQILTAEGEKEALILRSVGEKEATIAKAEGEALAALKIYEAQAQGIKLLSGAKPDKAYLTLKGYEALEKLASGQSTKLIVPSNLQDIAGTLASIGEILKPEKEVKTKKEKTN